MSKIKIINPSAEAMTVVILIDVIPENVAYETVKSIPSIMDDPYAHVL